MFKVVLQRGRELENQVWENLVMINDMFYLVTGNYYVSKIKKKAKIFYDKWENFLFPTLFMERNMLMWAGWDGQGGNQ